jgi:hypothetical protein
MWYTIAEWRKMEIETVLAQDISIDSDWFKKLKKLLPSIKKLYDLWQDLG